MTETLLAALLALAAPAFADNDNAKFSASRESGESFEHAREEFWQGVKGEAYTPRGDGAVQVAVPLERLDLSQVPAWPGMRELVAAFDGVRDARPLRGPFDFRRRLTWLYPDDGCYARAALMADLAEQHGLPRPRKVFVFGELEARTPNTVSGSVLWWYHVAPVVSVDGTPWVLDPAIEPSRALLLREWVARMQVRSRALKLSICSAHAYTPDSPCRDSAEGTDSLAAKNANDFLPREWDRVRALGHEPSVVLGDDPPWAVSRERQGAHGSAAPAERAPAPMDHVRPR